MKLNLVDKLITVMPTETLEFDTLKLRSISRKQKKSDSYPVETSTEDQ